MKVQYPKTHKCENRVPVNVQTVHIVHFVHVVNEKHKNTNTYAPMFLRFLSSSPLESRALSENIHEVAELYEAVTGRGN